MDVIVQSKYNYKAGLFAFFAMFLVIVIIFYFAFSIDVNSTNMLILLFCGLIVGLCFSIPLMYAVRMTTTRIYFTNKEEFLKKADTYLSEMKYTKDYSRDETGNFLSYSMPFGVGSSSARVNIKIYQNEAQVSGPKTLIDFIEKIEYHKKTDDNSQNEINIIKKINISLVLLTLTILVVLIFTILSTYEQVESQGVIDIFRIEPSYPIIDSATIMSLFFLTIAALLIIIVLIFKKIGVVLVLYSRYQGYLLYKTKNKEKYYDYLFIWIYIIIMPIVFSAFILVLKYLV